MNKINVGVMGSGFIVPVFIEETARYRDFHLRGIWARNPQKLEDFRNDFDYVTSDLKQLLNDESIDVIYLALPNSLHYEYAMKALQHGKHVFLEKPFTVYKKDAKKLIDYARAHELIIYEGVVTIHNPMYQKARRQIGKLGEIRMVECNYSQYSRRYDRFLKGEVLPAFDKKLAGGALYDLGVYNINFVTGIFGRPKKVRYYPNVTRGVDTSGVLILDYGSFKASLIAAKDCKTQSYGLIEGDKGYLRCNAACSSCSSFTLKLNSGKEEQFAAAEGEFGSWRYELKEFIRLYKKMDLAKAREYNEQTLIEAEVLEKAMRSAGLDY